MSIHSANGPVEGLINFYPAGQEGQLGSLPAPYYRSVGAVIIDNIRPNPNVYLLHAPATMVDNPWGENTQLMRETPEQINGQWELPEETIARGLREEFGGLYPKVIAPIGTLSGWLHNPLQNRWKRKDTSYYLVQCVEFDPSQREVSDIEGRMDILRLPLKAAAVRLAGQAASMEAAQRGDLIELPVIMAAAEVLAVQAGASS